MKRYLRNLLYWLTQTLNVWTGGDVDEYFSSRVGKAQRAKKTWGIAFAKIIDFFLGKNHCLESIEEDEGKDAVFVQAYSNMKAG